MMRVLTTVVLATVLAAPAAAGQAFDRWLLADIPVADGFDFPRQDPDTRYVATTFGENYTLGLHPGEDWNGTGGGDTDLGWPVLTVAPGKVVYAAEAGAPWGKVVVIF